MYPKEVAYVVRCGGLAQTKKCTLRPVYWFRTRRIVKTGERRNRDRRRTIREHILSCGRPTNPAFNLLPVLNRPHTTPSRPGYPLIPSTPPHVSFHTRLLLLSKTLVMLLNGVVVEIMRRTRTESLTRNQTQHLFPGHLRQVY